jgi:hypothetical protein
MGDYRVESGSKLLIITEVLDWQLKFTENWKNNLETGN